MKLEITVTEAKELINSIQSSDQLVQSLRVDIRSYNLVCKAFQQTLIPADARRSISQKRILIQKVEHLNRACYTCAI